MKVDQYNAPDFRFFIAFDFRIGRVLRGEKPAISRLTKSLYCEVARMDGDNHMSRLGFDRAINNQQVSITHNRLHAVAIEAPIECRGRVWDEFVEIELAINVIFCRRWKACAHAHQRKR